MSARRASHVAAAVLPPAVGPQMTRIGSSLLPAKATLELGPGELHDRGAAVHVVRGKLRVAQRDEERAHLARRKLVAPLDRGFARDGCRESFVLRMCPAHTVASQRSECFAQA